VLDFDNPNFVYLELVLLYVLPSLSGLGMNMALWVLGSPSSCNLISQLPMAGGW
jgi:hypothetical protein